jgi:hypothetical protein
VFADLVPDLLLVVVLVLVLQVEMFVVCTPEQSETLHQELIQIEQELFTDLGLHFKVGTNTAQQCALAQQHMRMVLLYSRTIRTQHVDT